VPRHAPLRLKSRGHLIETGHIVGTGTAQSLQSDPAVQRAYLGAAEPRVTSR